MSPKPTLTISVGVDLYEALESLKAGEGDSFDAVLRDVFNAAYAKHSLVELEREGRMQAQNASDDAVNRLLANLRDDGDGRTDEEMVEDLASRTGVLANASRKEKED